MSGGCTASTACNYDSAADVDDGSCDYISCAGCQDLYACNYDSLSTISDSSLCTYPASGLDCDGNCWYGSTYGMNYLDVYSYSDGMIDILLNVEFPHGIFILNTQ